MLAHGSNPTDHEDVKRRQGKARQGKTGAAVSSNILEAMESFMATLNNNRTTAAVVALSAVLTILVLLSRLLTAPRDPQEPPYVPSTIPLIGHLVRWMWEGGAYFRRLDKDYHYGIYTLPITNGRLYIVNSPDWCIAMHRCTKTLSFHTLVCQAMKLVFGMDEPSMKIVEDNKDNERGDHSGVLWQTHDMMAKVFAPGSGLDELNNNFLEEWTPHLNLLARDGQSETIQLWSWIRHHFSIASTAALWGPENPMTLDPSLEKDLWVFEDNIGAFLTMPYPSIFMRKAYAARQRVFDAFIGYAMKDGYKEASRLIQLRADLNLKHGFSKEMYGQGETSMLFAVLINTVPLTFWMLSYIFADPELLAEARAEIDGCIRTGEDGKRIVNATKLKAQCPLLNSAMRETFRIAATMNISRYVLEDTLMTNHSTGEAYMLKKGSMVTVAANVIHFQDGIYGEAPDTFDARRWIPTIEKARGDGDAAKIVDPAAPFRDGKGKIHSGAFRTFGGGNNICPGRHFATTEILSVVALFVAGFEIEMPNGGQYVPPPYEAVKMIAGVHKPGRDVKVKVKRRDGWEGVQWGCEM